MAINCQLIILSYWKCLDFPGHIIIVIKALVTQEMQLFNIVYLANKI